MKDLSNYRFLRNRWYNQVDKVGRTVKKVCNIFGVSRKTYYKWRSRDLGPKSTYLAKENHPNLKLNSKVKIFIEKEKLKFNYGPLKMKYLVKRELKIDLSTTLIYRFYKRKGLIRKKQKKLPWYQPIKKRVLALKAGANVQMDVQYIWHRRFFYRFRLIDEKTRMQFFDDHSIKDSQSSIEAFKKAQQYFPFPILAIQTDNGSENRGEFHKYLLEKNIIHRFIPKGPAPWNGKVERAHGIMNQEYNRNPNRIFQEPEQYLDWYNYERIHLGINGLTPYEKYLESVTS